MEEALLNLLGTAAVIFSLFIIGFLSIKIRIPNIILFILLGIVLSSFIAENEMLELGSEVGIILLFFLLGLDFPIDKLGDVSKKVWKAGILDILLCFGVSVGISLLFGLSFTMSLLLGGVLYATSSSITAKLLENYDRGENKESEFILALLIFEDLFAPITVAILLGISSGEEFGASELVLLLGKIILLTVGALVIGRLASKKLRIFIEQINHEDIYILFTIGLALGFGGIALYLELSEVLGAFLAGIILAETKKVKESERVTLPLRDLFLPIFFLSFGTTITVTEGIPTPFLLVVLLIWGIVAKIIVGGLGGIWFGLDKKPSLQAGLSITQRGEFSVIFAGFATEGAKIVSSLYVLLSSITGVVLFMLAPRITTLFFKKKK
ncbi:cation:proton antiporter [Metabacillus herbersteinensis]|uniref:Cation:proton antiporter n=1 Tax=Metabacillus herbersteinensis TaxID=283816 RepID=A0ABV6GGJ6_9BACI